VAADDAAPATRPAGYAFARGALDRAAELRADAARLAELAVAPGSRLLPVRADGRILVDTGRGQLAAQPATNVDADVTFLGLQGADAWFARSVPADTPTPDPTLRWLDLRGAAATLPADEAATAAYARALLHWQSRKRWCGVCGAPTRLGEAGHRAQCTDAACGAQYFPRTDPAIIVVVDDGAGRILLGRQPSWPEKRYSTLAGFVEPGETLEDAVRREVAEESGVRVGPVEYLASQPWPFPASLMLGFHGRAVGGELVVGSELADARWFDGAALPELIASGELTLPPALSISFHLVDHWFQRRYGRHLQPGPVFATR
jgi:NAD+ diphosphatase